MGYRMADPWPMPFAPLASLRWLKDELFAGKIFYSLKEALIIIENWPRHHDTLRPHGSVRYRLPALEVFVPAMSMRAALHPRPTAPSALAERRSLH